MTGLDNILSDGEFDERNPLDFYPTPWDVIEIILRYAKSNMWYNKRIDHILDIGAGTGRWGAVARSLWPNAQIIGYEKTYLDQMQHTRIKSRGYDRLYAGDNGDFLASPVEPFDLVMGNPPFYFYDKNKGGVDFFERILFQHTHHKALMAFFAPTSFFSTEFRYETLFREYPPTQDMRFMRRVSFFTEGHPRCGASNARIYCAALWLHYNPGVSTRVVYVGTHHNDDTYDGKFKGTDTWQEMCDIGLVPETNEHYLAKEIIT